MLPFVQHCSAPGICRMMSYKYHLAIPASPYLYKQFWSYCINRWEHLSGLAIKNSSILEECIIFDFPFNSDVIQVLNCCLLYTKYYIYIQCLFQGNKLDLYVCLTQLKFALEIEYNICKSTNNEICFNKYKFIYDSL